MNSGSIPATPAARKNTRSIGSEYESMAEDYLRQQGLQPVERNYLCALGEIDLVMQDSNYLVFVEVRYRLAQGYGSAIETISHAKQRKLIRTAHHYLANHQQHRHRPCRFDVIGIDKISDGSLQLNWLKNAIME